MVGCLPITQQSLRPEPIGSVHLPLHKGGFAENFHVHLDLSLPQSSTCSLGQFPRQREPSASNFYCP